MMLLNIHMTHTHTRTCFIVIDRMPRVPHLSAYTEACTRSNCMSVPARMVEVFKSKHHHDGARFLKSLHKVNLFIFKIPKTSLLCEMLFTE